MADKITNTNTLGIGVEYLYSKPGEPVGLIIKTTYIKLPNPKSNLDKETITNAALPFAQNILKADTGAPLSNTTISTAYRETQTTTELDIGIID